MPKATKVLPHLMPDGASGATCFTNIKCKGCPDINCTLCHETEQTAPSLASQNGHLLGQPVRAGPGRPLYICKRGLFNKIVDKSLE
jgi:hypothetical protein